MEPISFAKTAESAAVVTTHASSKPLGPGGDVRAGRHARRATRSTGVLAWDFVRRGRPQYLALLLSDYGRDIVTRKYDAFSTDRAYANRPAGLLGPVGRLIDRAVLDFPVHASLRERLAIVTSLLADEITTFGSRDEAPIRVLSAPCGLARDLIATATTLRERDSELAARLQLVAADLDESGDVLPEVARRSAAARVGMQLVKDDLLRPDALRTLAAEGGFDVVNCIGLISWLTPDEVRRLFVELRGFLHSGGALIVDNFRWHSQSHLGADLEIHITYHAPGVVNDALRAAGFEVERQHETSQSVCYVLKARAV
jgi:hypothetical protein